MTLIFFGSTHGTGLEDDALRSVLEAHAPNTILAEAFQEQRNVTEDPEHMWLVEHCNKHNIPLHGIDLKDYGFDHHLQDVVNGRVAPTTQDEKRLSDITEQRAHHHVQMIHTLAKGKTLVIVGAWHLRPDSPIRQTFPNAQYILPVDGQGHPTFGENPPVRWSDIAKKIFDEKAPREI